ncbi:MAG: mucoidy inhibitor MuiA family protein [Planctomycetota bacterium]|nr:mucoidy inhibitor MuiA family protein [Planctomycetota bacterium]
MSLAGLFLFVCASTPAGDPGVVASEIETVTVYPGSAMVTRVGSVDGPGSFVFPGLPLGMDPGSVRVRAIGGAQLEVLGVEARERFVREVEDERMAVLVAEQRRLVRELEAKRDELAANQTLRGHLVGLLEPGPASKVGAEASLPDLDSLKESGKFLGEELLDTLEKGRRLEAELGTIEAALTRVNDEHTLGVRGAGHQVRDVVVELDGPTGGSGGPLELEYLIQGAGWQPIYDLRVDAELESVELVYRAEVTQRTGEDWADVELLLSTARPEVGAAPPALTTVWFGLMNPVEVSRRARAAYEGPDRGLLATPGSPAPSTAKLNADEAPFDPAAYFASVLTGGSSLRYRVARRESIESRPDPTRVLVGRASLAVEAERFCTPALDPNVWLRGRAKNDSPWVLLPGPGSVYFGGDFVGKAQLDHVRLGERFDLHLGMDPMVTFERIELERKTSTSGFFATRKKYTDGWRLRFENHGAAGTSAARPAAVVVREVLPRSTDERLEIELEDANPPVSRDARWTRDREESGILTWVVAIALDRPTTIEWTSSMTFPEDLELSW